MNTWPATGPIISRHTMRTLQQIMFFLLCSSYISCNIYYDRDYYEQASEIKVPSSSHIIETFDNGEYYTVTSFKLEVSDMRSIIKEYSFKGIEGNYRPIVWGANDLGKERPNVDLPENYVYIMKSNKNLHISYLIDTVRQILWASISYPDPGGN